MAHQEFSLKADGNIQLFGQSWLPETAPKAIVLQVHGLGEHSTRYAHVAAFLNANGYGFYGYDHHGHGKTGGTRGHVPSAEFLMQEIDLMVAKIKADFPGIPVFIYGHSWGGNIALNYILKEKHDFKAGIITDPWLILPTKPPGFKVFLAKIMNNIYPAFIENSGLDPNEISYDKAEVDKYIKDPLVHGKISARNFLVSSAGAEYALANAGKNTLPLLMMHGKDDKITSVKGTEAFYKNAGGKNSMKLWDNMKHEIHNEVKKQEVLQAMLEWLDGHMN